MGATEKISITIGRVELRTARARAARRGLSLSMFITDAVRQSIEEQERREAAAAVLAKFAPEDRATAEEQEVLLERWGLRPRSAPKASAAASERKPRLRAPSKARGRSHR